MSFDNFFNFSWLDFSWPGLDVSAGSVTLPWWAPAAGGATLLLFFLLALFRAGALRMIAALAQIAAVCIAGWFAWSFIDQNANRSKGEERRALEARASTLAALVTPTGSALACLDANAGDTTENACERTLFASPESVAAAASYVAARLQLYADALDYATRHDPSYVGVLPPLRRSLEADRFGVVAQVLALQSGCTAEQCEALSVLRDPSRVRANLSERTFELLVQRHSAGWPTRGRAGQVSSTAPGAPGAAVMGGPVPSAVGLSFPSAASIPPVSIMTAEPPAAAPPSAAPAAAPAPAAAAPRRSGATPVAPAKQAPRPAPPVQLTPSASAGQRAQ